MNSYDLKWLCLVHTKQEKILYTEEETKEKTWEAWKAVYVINCSWEGDEFEGYDWTNIREEFETWWNNNKKK